MVNIPPSERECTMEHGLMTSDMVKEDNSILIRMYTMAAGN